MIPRIGSSNVLRRIRVQVRRVRGAGMLLHMRLRFASDRLSWWRDGGGGVLRGIP